MGLYSGGLIIGSIFSSEIWGAYFQEGLFMGEGGLLSEFYGMLFKSSTNYQAVIKHLYYNFLKPHKVDGKRLSSAAHRKKLCWIRDQVTAHAYKSVKGPLIFQPEFLYLLINGKQPCTFIILASIF